MDTHYRLSLWGTLRLIDPSGKDVSPKGAKAQGLLAILATRKGCPMSRSALQDLLWSDRGPTHGRDSLKKCIAALRKCFGEDGQYVIETSGGPVALNMSMVSVDLFETGATGSGQIGPCQFLDGIDVRDPEFEDWLRAIRRSLDTPDNHGTILHGQSARQQFHVALMPPVTASSDDFAMLLAELLFDRIAIAMRSYDVFKILDFRKARENEVRGADIVLELRALTLGDEVSLNLMARQLPDNEIVWGHRQSLPKSGVVSSRIGTLVVEVVDAMALAFRRTHGLGSERNRAAQHAMDGIERIFRIRDEQLDSAAASLRAAIDLDPSRSTYRAWYAFLHAFRLENSKGANLGDLRRYTHDIARQALEIDPHNPVTRSLLAHVYAFVAQDFGRAHAMLDPLQGKTPDIPFYFMSRAMLDIYSGRMEAARQAIRPLEDYPSNGIGAGMILTTRSMAELGCGNVHKSIALAEHARQTRVEPDVFYEPNLRYLVAGQVRVGNFARAREVLGTLQEQSPEHYTDALASRAFMTPSRHVAEMMPSPEQLPRLLAN